MYYAAPASQSGKFIVINSGARDVPCHGAGTFDDKSDAMKEAAKLNEITGSYLDESLPSDMQRLLMKLG